MAWSCRFTYTMLPKDDADVNVSNPPRTELDDPLNAERASQTEWNGTSAKKWWHRKQ